MALRTSFENIVGHARPIAILKAAIAADRIAHAYLFQGESRIGKLLTATAFAKAALCTGKSDPPLPAARLDACNLCSSCGKVDSGNHPDLRVLQPDGAQIKIAQIRELQNAIAYRPLIGSRKWFLIDEADLMNAESANGFLKTLEEPPDHSILILISARPQALPPTVLSRCQAVRFSPPPQSDLAHWLEHHRGIAPAKAQLLSMLAMGKFGAAAEADPEELLMERDRVLGAISREHLSDLAFLFGLPEELAGSQEQLYQSLDVIEIWLRDVLIRRYWPESTNLVNRDIRDRIRDWGRGIPTDSLLDIMTLIHCLRRAANRNLNNALSLESVLLKLRDAVEPDPAPDAKFRQASGKR